MSQPQLAHKTLNHVQALRGIAALLVMLAHLYDAELKYSPDHFLGEWTIYGNAGVDLFFLISGFIMVYVTSNRDRGVKPAIEFLVSRVGRIYPLYWIVSLAVLAVALIRPDMVFSSRDIDPILWKSFLLIPDLTPPLLLVGWTLIFEMYFYFVFSCLMLLKRTWVMPGLLLWLAAIGLGRSFGLHAAGPIGEVVFNPFVFEFFAGAGIAYLLQIKPEITAPISSSKNALLIGALIACLWGVVIWALSEFPDTIALRVIVFTLPAALTILYAASRDLSNLSIWKPLIVLGNWSYALYLTHILSVAVIGRIWKKFIGQGLMDNVMALVVMTTFSISVAGITFMLIERPIMTGVKKLRRRLFYKVEKRNFL